jgi:hypothetical protein
MDPPTQPGATKSSFGSYSSVQRTTYGVSGVGVPEF